MHQMGDISLTTCHHHLLITAKSVRFLRKVQLLRLFTRLRKWRIQRSAKKITMTRILAIILLSVFSQSVFAQVYTEKQSRHRFAQMNIGLDIQSSLGGSTKFLDANGSIQSTNLQSSFSPRFLIGGTHFWGHADFYIGIPLYSPTVKKENQEIISLRGVETVFKYYPVRIEYGKIRPYIGTSLAPFSHEQRNNNFEYPKGPALNYTGFPLIAGMTFNSKQHLFELGLDWNYQHQRDYYISRTQIETIETPPLFATISYRFILDTTLSAEKDWESGRTAEITTKLA
jgi:hypothetical protein